MKTHTHFAYRVDMWGDVDETFIERLAGIEDFEIALRWAAVKGWQSGHCVAPGLARDPRLPEARASELRLNADCGVTRLTRLQDTTC